MLGVPLSLYRQHDIKAAFAWCYDCSRWGELDLEWLIRRLGPDYPVREVAKKTVETTPS